MFFQKQNTQTKKEMKKGRKKKPRQACSFSRLLGDKLVFVRSLCGGKFIVSKLACGAVRPHACLVQSNAPGKSGQRWSLDRLTGRCALCYCVRGKRTQPLICVRCSVHYWVTCAINKGGF